MDEFGPKAKGASISELGLEGVSKVYWNLEPSELVRHSLEKKEGVLASSGALAVDTGEFTGRSPKDRFIVEDEVTKEAVWWGNVNIKFDSNKFDALYKRVAEYLKGKEIYIRDSYVCSNEKYELNIRVVTEHAFSNQFAYNMFLRPTAEELQDFSPEWTILNAPGFKADPERDGTRQHNFAILNL